jgi:4-aminobutyrate aminotransferase / (S)-3-amino-2-methylpropionate transaminase / 5-aminovalerate transaminase
MHTKQLEFELGKLGPIPGPRSLALSELRRKLMPRGVFHYHPIFIRQGQGALIEDADGNVFIDFAGGLGCLIVGSGPQEVTAAIHAQAESLIFSCVHVAMHEPYLALVEKLVGLLPGDFPKKAFLVNSGAEAVENAIKVARAFTRRKAIVTFQNSFHGRTLLALALTSKTKTYKAGFGPFPSEVYRIPYAYCYRCPLTRTYPACEVACAQLLRDAFENQVAPGDVAAVIVEPVQGEGGFVVPPAEYLAKLQKICREHDILFIVDEVQTGFGRTGSLFAFQQLGLDPDLLILSKSIAGGLPLSAVVGRADILDSVQVGGLGGTFGGSPLSCAAALEVIEKIARERLCERAKRIGATICERARQWQEDFPRIGDVRALGAMVGIEFVKDRTGREPATEYVADLKTACLRRGLVLIFAGTHSNVIRFLIPLVIDDTLLHQGLDILEGSMKALQ